MKTRLIWLSHVLSESTPLYGGARGISIKSQKTLAAGDSCNASLLTFPSHAGTHVDAPYHFLPHGKPVDAYPPETWVFRTPKLIEAKVQPGELLGPEVFSHSGQPDSRVDLVLLRTRFEQFRDAEIYWNNGPGLTPELAGHLRNAYPNVRAVGIDFLSVSSFHHRSQGHAAHRSFLSLDILLFEDLSLKSLDDLGRLKMVVALPLRVLGNDGAPCTIVGWEETP
jgi:kynurenine formamidase